MLCLLAPAAQFPAAQGVARLAESLTAISAGDDGAARRAAILTQLRALGVEAAVEPFGEGDRAGANVVVTLPAAGAARTIVVGAHYDRVAAGRGAVDNGAACAALIEVVAAFSAIPLSRSTLQVVFFDREESGLLGSRAFFAAAGRRVDFALNLDIFAYGDALFATASHPKGVFLRSLAAAGAAASLPVRDVPRSAYPASDHLSMMNAGIETLGVALLDAADIDALLAAGAAKPNAGTGPRILTIIHTARDTLAEVRPGQMMRGLVVIEDLLRRVDRGE